MKPILTRVCGYVLELQDDCFYVGISLNLNQRLSQHFDSHSFSLPLKYFKIPPMNKRWGGNLIFLF
jgi:hypothetical protein